jgi:hypothetical protein
VEEVEEDLLLILQKLEDLQVVREEVEVEDIIFHLMMIQEEQETVHQLVHHKVIEEELEVDLQIKEQVVEGVLQL